MGTVCQKCILQITRDLVAWYDWYLSLSSTQRFLFHKYISKLTHKEFLHSAFAVNFHSSKCKYLFTSGICHSTCLFWLHLEKGPTMVPGWNLPPGCPKDVNDCIRRPLLSGSRCLAAANSMVGKIFLSFVMREDSKIFTFFYFKNRFIKCKKKRFLSSALYLSSIKPFRVAWDLRSEDPAGSRRGARSGQVQLLLSRRQFVLQPPFPPVQVTSPQPICLPAQDYSRGESH